MLSQNGQISYLRATHFRRLAVTAYLAAPLSSSLAPCHLQFTTNICSLPPPPLSLPPVCMPYVAHAHARAETLAGRERGGGGGERGAVERPPRRRLRTEGRKEGGNLSGSGGSSGEVSARARPAFPHPLLLACSCHRDRALQVGDCNCGWSVWHEMRTIWLGLESYKPI